MAGSTVLAAANVIGGWIAGSTAVVAAGLEFAGDVIASAVVFAGMSLAAKPPDENHPYGHGRFETLSGLAVGVILSLGGIGICYRSLQAVNRVHPPPGFYVVWILLGTIVIRGALSTVKFRVGRRIRSEALIADAWNDAVDILSALGALVAVGLTIYNPDDFRAADHYGGFAVGLVVIFTGLRVLRGASMDLADTQPEQEKLEEIRNIAAATPGVEGVEKCMARRSGPNYYVDLHLEVDPMITVHESHEIAGAARRRIREQLEWVADVLVHIEPSPKR